MSFRVILGSPEILSSRQVVGKLGGSQAYNNNSRMPETDSGDPETENGREYIGYMVHWKRDYTRMSRSLLPPQKGQRIADPSDF